MIKVIFLDIDGVLNHELLVKSRAGKRHQLCRNSIKYLNTLIKNTNAKVVVTSTWRKSRTINELQKALDDYGFEGVVIDKTDVLGSHTVRGNEILKWIKDHEKLVGPYYKYSNYIILDDDSDMLYWQRNNFICVDGYCGLSPKDIWLAEKILNHGIFTEIFQE